MYNDDADVHPIAREALTNQAYMRLAAMARAPVPPGKEERAMGRRVDAVEALLQEDQCTTRTY